MPAEEHDDTQGIQISSNDRNFDESMDATHGSSLPAGDHPMDFHHDMMGNWTEENATSLFFDPSFNVPDPSLDFEWLFENISTDFNPNGDLPFMTSPGSSTSPSNISPPSFPSNAPDSLPYPPPYSPSAPWMAVQGRLLETLHTLPADIFVSSFFYPSNLSHFYDLYFGNYHPHFPILHKPTLDPEKAPPLLMAAVLTLGSTLSHDVAHFEAAVKIHDSLRYIIFTVRQLPNVISVILTPKSGDFEPPASLWCVQTLLLIQAHEKMFSTRKHHQLAHIFHGAIITVSLIYYLCIVLRISVSYLQQLMKRGVAYSSALAAPDQETISLEQSWHQWIETQSSNRTAFFGFVMDAQHSFMFGHTCVLSVHDVRLQLPCADSLWECDNAETWRRMMRKCPESPGFLPVLKQLLARHPIPSHCSAYGRLILLHGLFSVTAHLKARDLATLGVGRMATDSPRVGPVDSWKDTLERAMDTWSFSLVSRSSSLALEASKPLHRMAYVAIYTEIADMHILAGAPSLLGSLLSETDRSRATARVRAWSILPDAKRALYHCLLLVQEVMFTGQQYRAAHDNIALRPWALYHATLILWAYGFMTREREGHQHRSCTAEEYLVRMLMLLRNDSEEIGSVAQQTTELLQAVRESLEGCRWELLQEAHKTLGKLVDK